jgi:hypothetical protein
MSNWHEFSDGTKYTNVSDEYAEWCMYSKRYVINICRMVEVLRDIEAKEISHD